MGLQFMHLDEDDARDKRRSWHDKRESRIFSVLGSQGSGPHRTSLIQPLARIHAQPKFKATTVCTWDFDYFVHSADDAVRLSRRGQGPLPGEPVPQLPARLQRDAHLLLAHQ